MKFVERVLQLIEKLGAAVGRSIAAVHKTVDENALHFLFTGHLQEGEEMVNVRVYSAIAEQADQVELFLAAAGHRFNENGVLEKFAVANHQVEAGAIHVNDAPGADIQVADFAVAHLSIGQADPFAGGMNQSVREALEEIVIVRFTRKGDGVARCFGAETPAV